MMASLPRSLMPRERADQLLKERIEKGRQLVGMIRATRQTGDTAGVYGAMTGWDRYNAQLLRHIFLGGQITQDYEEIDRETALENRYAGSGSPTPEALLVVLHQEISILESIRERLPLIEEATGEPADSPELADAGAGLRVFIVHGHDHGLKQETARFIERLGLEAVILDEQPSQGLTIIEKFKKHARARYAIVLMTADDIGGPKNAPDQFQPRARQNVIFELGYFVARLGRGHVAALRKGGAEIPSDYSGVVYIDADRADWQFLLAKDMKAADLPIDLNRMV